MATHSREFLDAVDKVCLECNRPDADEGGEEACQSCWVRATVEARSLPVAGGSYTPQDLSDDLQMVSHSSNLNIGHAEAMTRIESAFLDLYLKKVVVNPLVPFEGETNVYLRRFMEPDVPMPPNSRVLFKHRMPHDMVCDIECALAEDGTVVDVRALVGSVHMTPQSSNSLYVTGDRGYRAKASE